MYLEFFELRDKPFELLPNPEFLFPSSSHRKALAYLNYGLQEHSGFILLTGEVGAGKTTLIRSLLDREPARTTIATLFNTQVDTNQLLRMILDDFGLQSPDVDKAELLRLFNDFLIEEYAAGRRCVLIIDEGQNLGPEQLEEIRLLSNLETSRAKLLQIILAGQPELRDRLSSPDLVQLRQRILVHCHLPPLSEAETADYILHRLECAGNREAALWLPGTLAGVHAAARGIPRLINILCDYLLLDAFSADRREIAPEHLAELLRQLDFEAQFWPEAGPEGAIPKAGPAGNGKARRIEADRLETLTTAVAGISRRLTDLETDGSKGLDAAAEDLPLRLRRQEEQVDALALGQMRLCEDMASATLLLRELLDRLAGPAEPERHCMARAAAGSGTGRDNGPKPQGTTRCLPRRGPGKMDGTDA